MIRKMMFMLSALALTACGGPDAATEAPVEIAAGSYAITSGGRSGPQFSASQVDGGAGVSDKVCLSFGDDADKIGKLVKARFALFPDCDHDVVPRAGNAIGGKMVCGANPVLLETSYRGRIAAEVIELEGDMQYAAAEGEGPPDPVGFTLTAKRVGDCN